VLLSDRDIRGEVESGRVQLDPYSPELIQPSSIDVRLDRYFRVFENHRYPHIDPAVEQPDLTRLVETSGDEPFVLHPGEFRARLDLRGGDAPRRCGRAPGGQELPRQAGAADAFDGRLDRSGFLRHVTLELSNVATLPIKLWPGMKIGQLCLFRTSSPAEHPYGSAVYGSRYQDPARTHAVEVVPQLLPHQGLKHTNTRATKRGQHPRRRLRQPGTNAGKRRRLLAEVVELALLGAVEKGSPLRAVYVRIGPFGFLESRTAIMPFMGATSKHARCRYCSVPYAKQARCPLRRSALCSSKSDCHIRITFTLRGFGLGASQPALPTVRMPPHQPPSYSASSSSSARPNHES